jgi:Recombination directionality factor-like
VIEPLGERRNRPTQVGRIRLGVKGGKQGRRAINTFRLTSQERRFLEPVAAEYGGEVKPWHESKSPDRFEVITDTRELDVILPPNAMDEAYEHWTGDMGRLRRCDTQWCDLAVPGPDGPEHSIVACICRRLNEDTCKYRLRLNVMLPKVESIGTWRLDTGSKNAKEEIPGVVAAIEILGGSAFTKAVLRLEQRTAPGRRFNVPVLDIKSTVEALVAGDQRLGVLPGGARTNDAPALGPGAPFLESFEPVVVDDEVIEAELVDDDPLTSGETQHVDPAFGRAWLAIQDEAPTTTQNRILNRARLLAAELGEPQPLNWAGVRTTSTNLIDRLVAENAHLLKTKEGE